MIGICLVVTIRKPNQTLQHIPPSWDRGERERTAGNSGLGHRSKEDAARELRERMRWDKRTYRWWNKTMDSEMRIMDGDGWDVDTSHRNVYSNARRVWSDRKTWWLDPKVEETAVGARSMGIESREGVWSKRGVKNWGRIKAQMCINRKCKVKKERFSKIHMTLLNTYHTHTVSLTHRLAQELPGRGPLITPTRATSVIISVVNEKEMFRVATSTMLEGRRVGSTSSQLIYSRPWSLFLYLNGDPNSCIMCHCTDHMYI